MCFLDTLQKLQDCGIWNWDVTGEILEFKSEDAVIETLHKLRSRKITKPSFKRNMTMFGFNIVERGKLNYQNKDYTRANRAQNIPMIQARVRAKNKVDNDNKKRKNEERDQLSEKIMKLDPKIQETASIIQQLPVSTTVSPIVTVTHTDNNAIIIPVLNITANSTSINTNTSNLQQIKTDSNHDSLENDSLTIDESYHNESETSNSSLDINVEDSNDQIADSTDKTGTQENKIDAEVPPDRTPIHVNILPNSGEDSPGGLEAKRNAYKLGLQHKQNEYQSMVQAIKLNHEREIRRLQEEKNGLEQALLAQIEQNKRDTDTNKKLKEIAEQAFHMGVNEGYTKVFHSLHANMFKLSPIAYSNSYESVSKTSKKSIVNNFKKEFT